MPATMRNFRKSSEFIEHIYQARNNDHTIKHKFNRIFTLHRLSTHFNKTMFIRKKISIICMPF